MIAPHTTAFEAGCGIEKRLARTEMSTDFSEGTPWHYNFMVHGGTLLVHHADLANATLTFDVATTPVHAVLPH